MLADIYILANPRSAALGHLFLDRFLPDRVPSATEYQVPQYADRPEMVLTNAADLIRLCEARPELRHAVYWNNRDLLGELRASRSRSASSRHRPKPTKNCHAWKMA